VTLLVLLVFGRETDGGFLVSLALSVDFFFIKDLEDCWI
jgi:hypothetical protein